MKTKKTNFKITHLKGLTIISITCSIISFTIYGMWIHAFNLGTTQTERVAIFKNYFPDFLNGRWDITFIEIAFCVSAIILSSTSLKFSIKFWKSVNILIIILSGLLLLLNLFSMM